jgi:fatty aldehyde-generating acyl-ACP reductase
MESVITNRLGVSLPVVVDFQGTVARGVTQDLSLDSISFLTDCASPVATSVSVLFYFNRNVAYLPLTGQVVAVTEESGDPATQFRIDVRLLPLDYPERRVLESTFEELEIYLHSLGAPESSTRAAARAKLVVSHPRSLLSLFVTDNPYRLPYRMPSTSGKRLPRADQRDDSTPLSDTGVTQNSDSGPAALPVNIDPGRFSGKMAWQGFGLVTQVLRDLTIQFLPGPLARLFITPITFAFIGHPRTLGDVPRKFPFARFLPTHVVERWFRYQWPFVASYITGLTLADGTPTTGAMLISPLTTEQMIRNPRLARQRVLQTVRLAEKMGAKIAGLGAFTSIVTRDGQDLEKKVHLGLTTGNPHSAAIAVQNVLHAAALTNLSLPHATAAIVGGAGSVGSACAHMLARLVAKLLLIDIKKDALQDLTARLAHHPAAVEGMTNLDRVRDADIVIAATNNPHVLLTAGHLKPGAIVIDAAQPKNVSEEIPRQRPDVVVIESAVVQTPDVDVDFDLDLAPGEALGCLSETMILTAIGWRGHYSLGKADPSHAAHIIAAGRALGFSLARFRNSGGYVTDEHLRQIAQARTTS